MVVEQGYIGYALDNGAPVLLPPGIHVWTSGKCSTKPTWQIIVSAAAADSFKAQFIVPTAAESLHFESSVPLDDHVIVLGPYTILTVDEGKPN